MRPSPCCQPKSADARFGMALSCVWACAAAPTAREAISTALHRKAVLDIASSSVTKFESTSLADADLPAVPLPTVRVPLYHHASPGTIPARAMPTRCRGDRTGDSGAFGYQGAAAP